MIQYIMGLTLGRDIGATEPITFSARITSVIYAFCAMVVVTLYVSVLMVGFIQDGDVFLGINDERVSIYFR